MRLLWFLDTHSVSFAMPGHCLPGQWTGLGGQQGRSPVGWDTLKIEELGLGLRACIRALVPSQIAAEFCKGNFRKRSVRT